MSDSREIWMVGDLLEAMSGSRIPDYVARIVQEVQNWLAGAVNDESLADPADVMMGAERPLSSDLDYLFNQLEWASAHADLIPVMKETGKHKDAVILSVGPIILDEGLRMMVDHAALFAAGICKKVWIISDTWIMGDILSYVVHLKALRDQGVEIHFLLVTPWGHSEIPWNRDELIKQ